MLHPVHIHPTEETVAYSGGKHVLYPGQLYMFILGCQATHCCTRHMLLYLAIKNMYHSIIYKQIKITNKQASYLSMSLTGRLGTMPCEQIESVGISFRKRTKEFASSCEDVDEERIQISIDSIVPNFVSKLGNLESSNENTPICIDS